MTSFSGNLNLDFLRAVNRYDTQGSHTGGTACIENEADPLFPLLWCQQKLENLADMYVLDDPEAIKDFLYSNDYLIDILLEAPYYIYGIFERTPIIHLELHRDPEEGWDELFIIIKSSYSAEEAIRLENELAEVWFLNRMKDVQGKLNFTEEPL